MSRFLWTYASIQMLHISAYLYKYNRSKDQAHYLNRLINRLNCLLYCLCHYNFYWNFSFLSLDASSTLDFSLSRYFIEMFHLNGKDRSHFRGFSTTSNHRWLNMTSAVGSCIDWHTTNHCCENLSRTLLYLVLYHYII